MPIEISEFYTELMQEVSARASARGDLTRTTLVEELINRLVDAEELQDWTPCYFDGRGTRRRAIGVDGYCADDLDLDGTLQILVGELKEGEAAVNLTTSDANAAFSRVTGFVADARAGRLSDNLEPSTPAADLAKLIHDKAGATKTLRVLVISNATLGSRYRQVEKSSIDDLKVELHVWDLNRFYQLFTSGGREEVDIDLTSFVKGGLPALPAGIGVTGYVAYLCVVPGQLLADIYDEYGGRLLEGNVRAFLSAKGNVNKGIRKTISACPEKFFAFNNGITATATSVETVECGGLHCLVRVRDLQIVNGGQTTASLYNARIRDRATLDGIFVQMKLSVLPAEVAQVMIPDISRYANTQNKVSDADLFANHPFHRKVEELSRRIWAPPRPGTHQMTHWFYERARAQYQTEQFKLRPSEKREFLIQQPKDQVITKTDLAKFENTWRQLPHVVSRGAQKSFLEYADKVRKEYDERPEDYNERWFQHLVAKAIVFRTMERIVSSADWYTGGYRANIVTYGIARFVKFIADAFPGRVLDLDRIWKNQRVSDAMLDQLRHSAKSAYDVLVAPPPHWSNVTEWAKKDLCWLGVSGTPVAAVTGLGDDLKPLDEERSDRRGARGKEREEGTINAVVEVVRLAGQGYWRKAMTWPGTKRLLSETEYGILLKAVAPGFVPTDAQAKRLMEAARRLDEEGLT